MAENLKEKKNEGKKKKKRAWRERKEKAGGWDPKIQRERGKSKRKRNKKRRGMASHALHQLCYNK